MIAFFDGNTVWRRKFADALQRRDRDVRIVCPTTERASDSAEGAEKVLRPFVPRGWASALSLLTMPYLNRAVEKDATRLGQKLEAIFVTTPHYVRLARRVRGRVPCYYYCSDDYLGYKGWHVEATRAREHELCTLATASIFVSEALRERAIANYGIARERTFVSPNATESRFAEPAAPAPQQLASLQGPIFGVVGMLTSRIDYDFLLELADAASGSLALVGPFDSTVDKTPKVQRLRAHPRVHCFGWQPHDTIPGWMAGFDVGVIPFAKSEFNRLCSPMRLFDHMAVGHPILATPACDQLRQYRETVIAEPGQLAAMMPVVLERGGTPRKKRVETWDDRVEALLDQPIGAPLRPGN